MMQLPYTLKLTDPVAVGTETVSELVFGRAPIARDLRGMRLSELDRTDNVVLLTARLAAVPPSTIEMLSLPDLSACGEVISGFLPAGPRTGSKPAA